MENPTHSFREPNLVIQLIYEMQIKSKAVMSWSLPKNEKDGIFCTTLLCQKDNF